MWIALVTLAPVGLVLGLLAFGRYGSRPPVEPTPPRVAWVAAGSVLGGPVAVTAVGLFWWLLLVLLLAGSLALAANVRSGRRPLEG